jgi:hypothetical protein
MKRTAAKQTSKGAARPARPPAHTPLTNPGHPLNRAKPEERAHPAERKVKHKHRPDEGD